jgi:hypothetical protein
VRGIARLEDLAWQCAPREEMLAAAREIVPEYQKDHAALPWQ